MTISSLPEGASAVVPDDDPAPEDDLLSGSADDPHPAIPSVQQRMRAMRLEMIVNRQFIEVLAFGRSRRTDIWITNLYRTGQAIRKGRGSREWRDGK